MLHLLLALQVAAAPNAAAPNDALRYDITLIPSDTGRHLLGEVETAWRLGSAEPVGVELDSSMRVVRVLIDGRPNTRLSRTMYGRSEDDLVVPHQKAAGDSITTRVRYHGRAHGAATVGANARGDRVFLATAEDDGARFWLPVPRESGFERVTASFRVQTLVAERSIAPGVLEKVDTLPYGHAVWRYRMDTSAPLSSLAVASGPYVTRVLTPGRCGDGCPLVEQWSYGGGSSETAGPTRAWEMVEWLAARAGRYPYARLAFVEAPVRAPVAAPGMVLIPEGASGRAGDSTLALATARQWFGLAVSPAAEEDRWVVDGLARYLATLWRDPAGRLTDTRGAASDRGRGARAMHALRGVVGDSVFFAGLARFTGDRAHQTASRADFARAMSAAAGRDLGPEIERAFARAR